LIRDKIPSVNKATTFGVHWIYSGFRDTAAAQHQQLIEKATPRLPVALHGAGPECPNDDSPRYQSAFASRGAGAGAHHIPPDGCLPTLETRAGLMVEEIPEN
jgi:hypothetical protein